MMVRMAAVVRLIRCCGVMVCRMVMTLTSNSGLLAFWRKKAAPTTTAASVGAPPAKASTMPPTALAPVAMHTVGPTPNHALIRPITAMPNTPPMAPTNTTVAMADALRCSSCDRNTKNTAISAWSSRFQVPAIRAIQRRNGVFRMNTSPLSSSRRMDAGSGDSSGSALTGPIECRKSAEKANVAALTTMA
jgi:hypothetical protein